MQIKKNTYLHFVSFHNFSLWDVKRYINNTKLHFANPVSLKKILVPYKQTVSKEKMIQNRWRIISKINFDGELFLRDFDKIKSYKGKLNLVPDNAIIYSKINVRHGCIYYHKKGNIPFGVSSEYPIYTFDNTKVNGAFLQKLLRCDVFKSLLNTKTAGISKSRVKTDDFLDIQIPLPLLVEQTRIIKNYNAKIQESEDLEKYAKELKTGIESYLFEILGIEYRTNKLTQMGIYLKTINYARLEKWGANQNTKNQLSLKTPYKIKKIKEICTIGSGGTPSRENKHYYKGDIPWIKTGEVVNDIIYDTEEKISQEAIENSSAKIYPRNSLIIAMYGQGATRGRTAKLGIDASTNQACAVLHNIDETLVYVDYLWIYLMNEYERLRCLASGNNQPNLNAEKIKNYPVVIPPLLVQEKIIKYILGDKKHKIEGIIDHIKRLQQNAEEKRKIAITEFEKEIFE